MTQFLQAGAGVLLTVILCFAMGKESRELAAVLTIAVCAMVLMLALSYLRPVLDFLKRLEELGNLDSGIVQRVLKVVGIGLISEIASTVCRDAGKSALANAMQMLSGAVILWISLPVFSGVMELVQDILGGV